MLQLFSDFPINGETCVLFRLCLRHGIKYYLQDTFPHSSPIDCSHCRGWQVLSGERVGGEVL